MDGLATALDVLHDAERRLAQSVGERASLDPARGQATPLPALGERLLREIPDASQWLAHARALAQLALAQAEHFPDNLFWDLDYPAHCMLSGAQAYSGGALAYLARYTELMTALHAAYGQRSAIRFRYVHDFTYGFDWERWVSADSETRTGVGPFDLPFLERTLERSGEIEQAIRRGDSTFPALGGGQYRNPFGFAREPDAELRLYRELLARDAIPVRSFDPLARPDYRLGASRLREQLATELGLTRS